MKNNVAVITGAASGIGLALTQVCLKNKMHVVMADLPGSSLFENSKELQNCFDTMILPVVCDITKENEVTQLAKKSFDHFNEVNLLINNAGISGLMSPIWESDINDVKKVIDVNLYGAINCIQKFLPLMLKQINNSKILNIASVYGLIGGSLIAPYSMSKHAMIALSESLFFDLRARTNKIEVSVACPSFVNTNLLKNSQKSLPNKLHEKMINLMHYSDSADDIANQIFNEMQKGTFYILPNKEVEGYLSSKFNAIKTKDKPHEHELERVIQALNKKIIKTNCREN